MQTSELAQSTLKKHFGYHSFRPLQSEIIETIVNHKDSLVLMPTGGGKSICYQLPALLMEGTCIVVSPLISLMKDQVDALHSANIKAAYMNSSQTPAETIATWEKYRTGALKLLYISPEKLISKFDRLMNATRVSLIAIDEAHCISSWGHDFREEYTKLSIIKKTYPKLPVIALTATADKLTREDIIKQLKLTNTSRFISSFDRPNLSIRVRSGLSKKKKENEIISFIKKREKECGIIYCLSRKNTESLSETLENFGIKSGVYHAGMSAKQRNKVQTDFINDEIQIICATIAFGMGIDKSNVRWVIHYNMPKNIESYYQEIGRAGRDGLPSDTVLYYNYNDALILHQFALESGQAELNISKLKRMQHFAEATTCRRKIILTYFNEHQTEDCGNCDVCKNPPKMIDGTIIAQKALAASFRTKEKVGTQMLIKILRGSSDKDLINKNYHFLKTYGVGKEISTDHWQQYIMQMLNLGLFEIAYDRGFALAISESGKEVLYSKRTVELAQAIDTPSSKSKSMETFRDENHDIIVDELFESLRQLRLAIAKRDKVPPYIVFNDAALKEMALKKPVTSIDFLMISGVGEAKLEKYGKTFINCIQEYLINQE